MGGVLFLTEILHSVWNGARYDQGCCLWSIGSRIMCFPISVKINDLGWSWRDISMHSCFEILVFSEFTVNIWMKIDRLYRRQKCTNVSSFWQYKFYSYMDIHEGSVQSRLRGGVKRQWGCRQRQFPVLSLVTSLESLQIRATIITVRYRPRL